MPVGDKAKRFWMWPEIRRIKVRQLRYAVSSRSMTAEIEHTAQVVQIIIVELLKNMGTFDHDVLDDGGEALQSLFQPIRTFFRVPAVLPPTEIKSNIVAQNSYRVSAFIRSFVSHDEAAV